MVKKIVWMAHDMLIENRKMQTAVDFTCGGGSDTLFLAQHAKRVDSYEIQEEAIREASEKLTEYEHVHLHLKSHLYFDEDVQHFDSGIFNLGYYPKGNKAITTDAQTVIETLNKALPLLDKKGRIIIVCYPGFEHGRQEGQRIEEYAAKLPARQYDVLLLKLLNRKEAPYIIGIDKHA